MDIFQLKPKKRISQKCNTQSLLLQVIRTACYTSKLIAAIFASEHPNTASKFSVFGSQMSHCRATLRLFDDLPMLNSIIQYGLGRAEQTKILSAIGILANVSDALYYPVDKICWFVEHKLMTVKNPTFWDTLSSLFWLVSNYLNLIRNLLIIRMKVNKDTHHSGSEEHRLVFIFLFFLNYCFVRESRENLGIQNIKKTSIPRMLFVNDPLFKNILSFTKKIYYCTHLSRPSIRFPGIKNSTITCF